MSNQTEISTPAQKLEGLIRSDKVVQKFKSVMPSNVNMDNFIVTALKYCNANPKIINCGPSSVLQAVFDAAAAGVLLDGREGFINVYGGKCHFQTMYKGNAKRAGLVKWGAVLVHAGDHYQASMTLDGAVFEYSMSRKDRGPLELAVAWSIDTDGFKRIVEIPAPRVLEVAEKEKTKAIAVAKRYGKTASGPWFDSFDQMAKKHVINVMTAHISDTENEEQEQIIETVDYETGEITEKEVKQTKPKLNALQQAVQQTINKGE